MKTFDTKPTLLRVARQILLLHYGELWAPIRGEFLEAVIDAWMDLWSACALRAIRPFDSEAPLDQGLYIAAATQHVDEIECLVERGLVSLVRSRVVSPLTTALSVPRKGGEHAAS